MILPRSKGQGEKDPDRSRIAQFVNGIIRNKSYKHMLSSAERHRVYAKTMDQLHAWEAEDGEGDLIPRLAGVIAKHGGSRDLQFLKLIVSSAVDDVVDSDTWRLAGAKTARACGFEDLSELESLESSPQAVAEEAELRESINQALRQLPDDIRQAAAMLWGERDHREVCEQLDCSRSQAFKLRHRALDALKRMLDELR